MSSQIFTDQVTLFDEKWVKIFSSLHLEMRNEFTHTKF